MKYGNEEIIRRIFDDKGAQIGYESKFQEIVRCKDCKYYSTTTIGMPNACWKGAYTIFGETGEHAGKNVAVRIDSEEHFCSYGEREN